MLMYTSCGWFFDELSGIETVQVIHYAGRAVRLGEQIVRRQPGSSNSWNSCGMPRAICRSIGTARNIYEKWVKPAIADMPQVAAHYAISSLFETYTDRTRIYCYEVQREDFRSQTEGKMRLATGRARVSSQITAKSATLNFGVLHMGDHSIYLRRPRRRENDPSRRIMRTAFRGVRRRGCSRGDSPAG